MKNELVWIILGIAAIIFVSGCVGQSSVSFSCDYMNAEWVNQFGARYDVFPDEAVQCDATNGSAVIMKFSDSSAALSIAAKIGEEIVSSGSQMEATYYEKICSSSNNTCMENVVVADGKINGAGTMDTNPFILVINSEKPEDAELFLNGLWAKNADIKNMLAR
jgi:hypothetical protein